VASMKMNICHDIVHALMVAGGINFLFFYFIIIFFCSFVETCRE
jgi:hypothetical protein